MAAHDDPKAGGPTPREVPGYPVDNGPLPEPYPSNPSAYPTGPTPTYPAEPYPVENHPVDPVPVPSATDTAAPKAPGRRSRAGSAWIALIVGTVVLIFLLVFVLQNGRSVEIHYFGWQGSLSLGVAMLFAAIGGALVAGLFGTVRILQLRTRARKAAR